MVANIQNSENVSPNSPLTEFELSRVERAITKLEKHLRISWVGRIKFDERPALLSTHAGYSIQSKMCAKSALEFQYYSQALEYERASLILTESHISFGIGINEIFLLTGSYFTDSTIEFAKSIALQRKSGSSFFLTSRNGVPYPFSGGILLDEKYSSVAARQHEALCLLASRSISVGGSFAQYCAAGTYRDVERFLGVMPQFHSQSSVYYPESELLSHYEKLKNFTKTHLLASQLHAVRDFKPGSLF